MYDFVDGMLQMATWLTQNMVNLLFQSTALIVCGLFAAWLVRKQGSAVQSAIYRATLVAVLICPLAAAAFNFYGFQGLSLRLPDPIARIVEPTGRSSWPEVSTLPEIELESAQQPAKTGQAAADLLDQDVLNAEPINESSLAPATFDSESSSLKTGYHVKSVAPASKTTNSQTVNRLAIVVYSMVAIFWLAGSIFMLLRLLKAFQQLNQLRRQSFPADNVEREICEQLCGQIGVKMPQLQRNGLLASPCLIGISVPTILLPVEVRNRNSVKKALAHELAHLRRYDILWNLVQRVGLAFLFFQPLMWRLVYRLEATAEEVCDDVVVQHCVDRTGYARQLVDLAESNLLPPNFAALGMFRSNSLLGHRVNRILDSTRMLTTSVNVRAILVIAVAAIVATTLGGFLGHNSSGSLPLNDASDIQEHIRSDASNDPSSKLDEIVRGTVVDQNGDPVADATVQLNTWTWSRDWIPKTTTVGECQVEANGKFDLNIDELNRTLSSSSSKINAAVVVKSAGFASAQIHWHNIDKSKPLQIVLNPQSPVIGKVINLEGQPVANAKVFLNPIRKIGTQTANLWLTELRESGNYPLADNILKSSSEVVSMGAYSGVIEPFVETNALGEFEINRLPQDALFTVRVEHAEVATQIFQVFSRSMPDIRADYPLYGDRPVLVTQPARPIVGTVVEAETGLPVQNATIYCHQTGTRSNTWRSRPVPITTSDQDGKFELLGVAKSENTRLTIFPPKDKRLLIQDVLSVPDSSDVEPVQLDIKLDSGVWIRGQVTDKQTGKGVESQLVYIALRDNPHLGSLTGYQQRRRFDAYKNLGHFDTDDQGNYCIVGIPGRAVLGARTDSQTYASAVGFQQLLNSFGQKYSQEEIEEAREIGMDLSNGRFLDTRISYSFQNVFGSSFVGIQPTEGILEVTQDIKLDSGIEILAKAVDANGEAVESFEVSNVDGFFNSGEFQNGIARIQKVTEDEVRTIRFTSQAQQLGAIVQIPSELNQQNDTVVLKPFAKAQGRLVDDAGNPLVGYKINSNLNGKTVVTDEQGMFHIANLISDHELSLDIYAPGENEYRPYVPKLKAIAGETLQLGDINLDAIKIILISGVAGMAIAFRFLTT